MEFERLRADVLVIIGRDAGGRRHSSVIQTFAHNSENKPAWEKPVMAIYNQPPDVGYGAHSLLDWLLMNDQERR